MGWSECIGAACDFEAIRHHNYHGFDLLLECYALNFSIYKDEVQIMHFVSVWFTRKNEQN